MRQAEKALLSTTLEYRREGLHIDEGALEARFRSLQMAVHPDKFASKDEQLQALAEQQSAYLNTSMAILRSPLQRATYLVGFCSTSHGTSKYGGCSV